MRERERGFIIHNSKEGTEVIRENLTEVLETLRKTKIWTAV